jgi:ABC-type branched-subunit amino acid transport system ATPase component
MYLQRIEITNYACLRDVKMDFTPLHALIGPNDSGKSTILRAVRTLTHVLATATRSEKGSISIEGHGLVPESRPCITGHFEALRFSVSATPEAAFSLEAQYGTDTPPESGGTSGAPSFPGLLAMAASRVRRALAADAELEARVTKPANLLRLDPDVLRQQSNLIPENELVVFSEYGSQGMRGGRLPGVYDAIMNRGDDAFAKIARQARGLFPTVRNVRLRTVSDSQKCLEVELTNGTRVPAAQMSEGLLYFLAYAALPYVAPASILLIEEPENGLHPSRIRDVMNILKEISKTTQVLIATHSPLVVNELEGDQVTVVTRDIERGTQVRRLSATADFEVRSKAYLPGELWLNYANGVDEVDLLSPRKPET